MCLRAIITKTVVTTMRKANPNWHGKFTPKVQKKGWTYASKPNALNIYLEIIQNGGNFEVKTWDNRIIGVFSNIKEAETCASNFRTPLMPTSKITDIRFIPDPHSVAPKPRKHEKVVMEPITAPVLEFVPIQEDEEEKVVEHPDDIVVF